MKSKYAREWAALAPGTPPASPPPPQALEPPVHFTVTDSDDAPSVFSFTDEAPVSPHATDDVAIAEHHGASSHCIKCAVM